MFNPKMIIIHNTNNEKNAKENIELMNKMNANGKIVGVHFFVDENGVFEGIPLSEVGIHCGNFQGDSQSIAIEICETDFKEENYREAEKNTYKLIKKLMKEFDINRNFIFFHNDFEKTKLCPHRILEEYADSYSPKEEWLKKGNI